MTILRADAPYEQQAHILVVDEDSVNRMLTSTLLKKCGFYGVLFFLTISVFPVPTTVASELSGCGPGCIAFLSTAALAACSEKGGRALSLAATVCNEAGEALELIRKPGERCQFDLIIIGALCKGREAPRTLWRLHKATACESPSHSASRAPADLVGPSFDGRSLVKAIRQHIPSRKVPVQCANSLAESQTGCRTLPLRNTMRAFCASPR